MGVVSLLAWIFVDTDTVVQVGDSVNPDLAGDLMVTTTPILNIDRLPDYQYAGLPLGQSSQLETNLRKAFAITETRRLI